MEDKKIYTIELDGEIIQKAKIVLEVEDTSNENALKKALDYIKCLNDAKEGESKVVKELDGSEWEITRTPGKGSGFILHHLTGEPGVISADYSHKLVKDAEEEYALRPKFVIDTFNITETNERTYELVVEIKENVYSSGVASIRAKSLDEAKRELLKGINNGEVNIDWEADDYDNLQVTSIYPNE